MSITEYGFSCVALVDTVCCGPTGCACAVDVGGAVMYTVVGGAAGVGDEMESISPPIKPVTALKIEEAKLEPPEFD